MAASVEQANRALQEKSDAVKQNAFYMKRALDNSSLREALRFSSSMLAELRTSELSPPKYYELYMQVFDELTHLQGFLVDELTKPGATKQDLYALVQHAGNVLPRVYLMCTVGCVLIRTKQRSAKELLSDLVEMCKGVQHPTRGLFLRSYLCQVSRGVLPDGAPQPSEGEEGEDGPPGAGAGDPPGTLHDSIDFLLHNFVEMNKLWVRMQNQGSARDRARREVERSQVQDLVGKNLTCLSQLEGLDFDTYANTVLPRVMAQVTQCKDPLAQGYLMQAIIQGFPDEFHLGSVEALLAGVASLQPGVPVHSIMAAFMDRLARYVLLSDANMERCIQVDAFAKLRDACNTLAVGGGVTPAQRVEMFRALLGFTESVHAGDMDRVNGVLEAAAVALQEDEPLSDPAAERQLLQLLHTTVSKCGLLAAVSLPAALRLAAMLRVEVHLEFAISVAEGAVRDGVLLPSRDAVAALFQLLRPLLEDVGEAGAASNYDDEELQEQGTLVARLTHNLRAPDAAQQHAIDQLCLEQFTAGGPRRWMFTAPPLAFSVLRLARRISPSATSAGGDAPDAGTDAACSPTGAGAGADWAAASSGPPPAAVDLFKFGQRVVALVMESLPFMGLRLLLAYAVCASEEGNLMLFAQDFLEQAFLLYEEAIPDCRSQVVALFDIIGCLHRCYIFPPAVRRHLTHKAFQYSLNLLKKSDQCRALCACSHLHWQTPRPGAEPATAAGEPGAEQEGGDGEEDESEGAEAVSGEPQPPQAAVQDPKAVMSCLQRAVRITSQLQQQMLVLSRKPGVHPFGLYVHILNEYLYYFEMNKGIIASSKVQTLLDLLANESPDDLPDAEAATFYRNTLRYIRRQQAARDDYVGHLYAGLNIPPAVS